jgi:hypothetical protein
MKSVLFKSGICLLAVAMLAGEVSAQRTGRRRAPAGNPSTTPTQQTNLNQAPTGDPYGGLAIEVDSSGVADTIVRKSLRNDNAYDKSSVSARTPLTYEHLRADDALFAEKVWRELDLREKMNQAFRYEAQSDNGSQMFIDMLLKAVNSGEVTAFQDDRFSIPLPISDIQQQTMG